MSSSSRHNVVVARAGFSSTYSTPRSASTKTRPARCSTMHRVNLANAPHRVDSSASAARAVSVNESVSREQQQLTAGKIPVQGADAGSADDGLHRHVRPAIDEQRPGRQHDAFLVAPGVGPATAGPAHIGAHRRSVRSLSRSAVSAV
jgi:hypothetical protein